MADGRGGKFGNKNAVKAKDWERALRTELHHYEDKDRGIAKGTALANIAKKCVEQALNGDKDARSEIANRLDGKAREHVDVDFTHRLAQELTDDELLNILRNEARGGDGTAAEATGSEDPAGLH